MCSREVHWIKVTNEAYCMIKTFLHNKCLSMQTDNNFNWKKHIKCMNPKLHSAHLAVRTVTCHENIKPKISLFHVFTHQYVM